MLRKLLNRLLSSGRAPLARDPSLAPREAAADRLIAEGNRAEGASRVQEAPGYAKAHLNLGIGLEAAGATEPAAHSYEAGLAIDPADPFAAYNLGKLLYSRGMPAEAERLLRQALQSRPGFPEAQVVLSCVLESQGNLGAAAAALETAMRLRPNDFGALYRAARERCPDDIDLESAQLFALNSSEQIAEDALFARHAAFGARIEQAHPPRFEPFRNVRDPERRLRIGYVSGDFCYHVVTLFTLPVVERHDRSAIEVYCYSTGGRVDDYTRQLSARADIWREVSSLSASGLADAINRDGIDILVDLDGHSGIPQLAVFAQQPASVQASWLGYLNTTGMTRSHYRISDRHADAPGLTDPYHTETLVRLPHSQWCYRPFISVACAEVPPFVLNGHITFGSFNQALKISRTVRRLWAEILQRVPGSRLVILGVAEGRARDELLADLEGAGGERARITVLPYASLQDYFEWFNSVDIALDTMPYRGGTTTCDALWMGVPVVTAPGLRRAARRASSRPWDSPSGSPRVPRVTCGWPPNMPATRRASSGCASCCARRLRRSLLMDVERLVRDLEATCRQMWCNWCGGAVAQNCQTYPRDSSFISWATSPIRQQGPGKRRGSGLHSGVTFLVTE